jgi:GT2 family glycosyltransferase
MKPFDDTLLFTIDWRNREQSNHLIASLAELDARLLIIVNDNLPPVYQLPERGLLTIEIIQTGRNTGFAAACNIALQHAQQNGYPFIMDFNNDVIITDGHSLTAFIHTIKNLPNCAVASPSIYRTDGVMEFAGLSWLSRISPALIVSRKRPPPDIQEIQYCLFFHGGCYIARTEILLGIGGFDEHYFAYREEHDLAHRLTTEGWKITYIPCLQIQHVASASSSRTPYFRELLITRGQLRYFKKNVHGMAILPYVLLVTLKTTLKLLIALAKNDQDTLKAVRDAIKNQIFNQSFEVDALNKKIRL